MDTKDPASAEWSADAYLAKCPSRTVLSAIADKWTCLVVDTLADGPHRFSVLRRRLGGITQKSLTQTLRNLERDGMVIRTVYPTIPPRVDYELSELGRSVTSLMAGIRRWSEDHVHEILAARDRYAARQAEAPKPVTTTPAPA